MTEREIGFEMSGEPTPRQIAERTAAIRETWSPAELNRRVSTIPHLESDLGDDRFTLGVECRNCELEDK
jgi:hypothetical protein